MGDTSIEWTQGDDGTPGKTWNPVRGCSRVSDGCLRCYAEGIARRFSGPSKPYEGLIHSTGRWNGQIHLAEDHLLDPIRWGKGRRIFVNSMSDLFHEAIPFEYIDKVFAVMACTTRHTYQVLTKRPARMLEYFERLRWNSIPAEDDEGTTYDEQVRWHGGPHGLVGSPDQIRPSIVYDEWKPNRGRGGYDNCGPLWPLENVWLGVSCENQDTADERIPLLLKVPAAIRSLSCEPLLGPIDLTAIVHKRPFESRTIDVVIDALRQGKVFSSHAPLDWVIVGGESGPGARPMGLEWATSLVQQCQAAGVAVFVKQLGASPRICVPNFPIHPKYPISDRKGAVMAEWPERLQVRQWPVTP
jgi:protein gp37